MTATSPRAEELEHEVAELEGAGTADDILVDRRAWRAIRVSGGDAERWLNDLLTAELAYDPTMRRARSS